MSIVTEAADVAVNGLWKIGAIIVLVLALVVGVYLGYEWYMAAHDRDAARADLVIERKANADLTSAIHDQNMAVAAMAAKTADAETRRDAAEKAAAAAIARSTTRASAVSASTAANCTGVLNDAWGAWK